MTVLAGYIVLGLLLSVMVVTFALGFYWVFAGRIERAWYWYKTRGKVETAKERIGRRWSESLSTVSEGVDSECN